MFREQRRDAVGIAGAQRDNEVDVLRQARLAVHDRRDAAADHPLDADGLQWRCEQRDNVSRLHAP